MTYDKRAEENGVTLRFKVISVVSEEIFVSRDTELEYEFRVNGVVPDDIGMSRIAGRPVNLKVAGFSDFPRSRTEDVDQGVSEGLSIGFLLMSHKGIHIAVNVDHAMAKTMVKTIRSGLKDGEVSVGAGCASNSLPRRQTRLRPNDLRQAKDGRVAVVSLVINVWSGATS